MANWRDIKSQYEIMHASVKELSANHHVGESMILHAIESEGWTRKDVNSSDVVDYSNQLALLGQESEMAMVPKFLNLREMLLDKCRDILKDVTSIEDAANLKIVSDVIEKHRPDALATKGAAAGDNQLNIRIMTQAGSGSGELPNVSAVEISPSAGEVNGLGASNRGLTKVQ